MKAIILAAGRGTRLKPLTNKRPKCFVEVNGKPIIEYQIESLIEAGISDIFIVAGYMHEKVSKYLSSKYSIIINEKYDITNSMYSLWLAKDYLIRSEFLLLNGDVVLKKELIKKIVNYKEKTAALIETGRKIIDGEMNVIIKNGIITAFSKNIDSDIASGESVQITKFSKDDSSKLFNEIEKIISLGNLKEFPAAAYHVLIAESKIWPVYTDGLDWFEIDTIDDYNAINQKESFSE